MWNAKFQNPLEHERLEDIHILAEYFLLHISLLQDKLSLSTEKTRRFSNHVSRLLSQSHIFAIIVIRFENTSKYVDTLTFFPKTWTKGHWPLDDLWPHVCWGHMCDSTQGSLCPSPMTINHCMWIQWSILQNTTYIHILRTYYILVHTTYRMSDHIVSYWTQFRRDKNGSYLTGLKWIVRKKQD